MFLEHPNFKASLSQLYKRGGRYQKAAKDILAMLERSRDASYGDPFEGMRHTKHGESRIDHCVKYDLNGFCRLITVQTDGRCILLFCGDHEASDRWLEANRGLIPVVDRNRRGVVTYQSAGNSPAQRIATSDGHFVGVLFERLPESDFELLVKNVDRKVVRSLEKLRADTDEGLLWETVAPVGDSDHRKALYDVFALLKTNRLSEAIARVRTFAGELVPLASLRVDELPEIVDSMVLRRIDPRSPEYNEALSRFMKSARYRDWMTFLHPDQEAIVLEDFNGPAKLVGVSGSGKTCVVVRRAVRLAAAYPGEQVLVVTLNRALATLIDELVSVCAPERDRERILVRPFFDVCRDELLGILPQRARVLDERTWKTSEHVDEIWTEFYRCENNNYDARQFQPVHDALLSREWDPERYLREEFDWIRSALVAKARTTYKESTFQRRGRTVPMPRDHRELVLQGLRSWEEKMEVVGLIDSLGIAQELSGYLSRVKPRYRCVLIDEVQDFGNVELEILRALTAPCENDLFLCGDAAQAVTTKHQSFKEAGITLASVRSRRLSLNYRNSRDVLQAAYHTLFKHLSDEMIDREDFEVLDPEYSSFSDATPLMLEGGSLANELACAFALAMQRVVHDETAKVCIVLCGYSLYELTPYGIAIGRPVLDGKTSIEDGSIFLSDLEQTKGFEFDMVIIVNCTEGVFPDRFAPVEERHRDLARLYVAMTRARKELVVSYSATPSPFFGLDHEHFLYDLWSSYIDDAERLEYGVMPRPLDAIRDSSVRTPWRGMTGEEFLRTPDARGSSLELIGKIRALVDGKGLMKRNQQLRFKTMGQAAAAWASVRTTRQLWGPEVGRQFESLLGRLSERDAEDRPATRRRAAASTP